MWVVFSVVLAVAPAQERLFEAHRSCTQRKDAAACERALTAYPPYLEVHASDWDARFFFAELLWSRGLFAEAAGQYHLVARSQSRHAKSAALNEIVALSRLGRSKPHRRDGQPWPLTVEQHRLIDAIDFLCGQWPAEASDDLKITAVRILFDAHDFEGAERRIRTLANQQILSLALDTLKVMRGGEIEPLGNIEPIGESQAVGSPQEIGAPQQIGSPQTIGAPLIQDTEETEREEQVELESVRVRFDPLSNKRDAADTESLCIY